MVTAPVAGRLVITKQEPPIWRESLVGFDLVALGLSPVFYGIGVPKGDRCQGVVLIPGFLETDAINMGHLYLWLLRIGYIPFLSNIGINAKCLDKASNLLKETIDDAYAKTQKRIWLIGHSLGGLFARSAAVRWPEKIGGVITLGTPFQDVGAHPWVMTLVDLVGDEIHRRQPEGEKEPDCFTDHCSCPAVTAYRHRQMPDCVKRAAVYTQNDGVVDWNKCIEDNPELNHRAISLCHSSLACSWSSFQIVANIMKDWLTTQSALA